MEPIDSKSPLSFQENQFLPASGITLSTEVNQDVKGDHTRKVEEEMKTASYW